METKVRNFPARNPQLDVPRWLMNSTDCLHVMQFLSLRLATRLGTPSDFERMDNISSMARSRHCSCLSSLTGSLLTFAGHAALKAKNVELGEMFYTANM